MHAVKHAAVSTGQFVARNRGTLASIAAIGACISPAGLFVCGAASLAASAIRIQQRGSGHLTEDLVDGGLTLASFGLLGATSSAGESALEGLGLSGGAKAAAGYAYRAHATLPDFFHLFGGG